jgi:PAS domain S-box-containing protein
MRHSSLVISVAVLLVSGGVLLGWIADIPVLRQLKPGWLPMAPHTAVAFIFAGVSFSLQAFRTGFALVPNGSPRTWRALAAASDLAAFVPVVIGLDRLSDFTPVSFDLLPAGAASSAPRMSMAVATNLVLLGVALLAIRRNRLVPVAQGFALILTCITWLGFARYLYGTERELTRTSMAFHTAALFLLLALGLLNLRSHAGWTERLTRGSAGGLLVRFGLPLVLLGPPVFGWMTLQVLEQGFLAPDSAFIFFSLLGTLLFGAFVWVSAGRIDRHHRQSERAQAAVLAGEERMRLILESAIDAVIAMDGAGRVTGWNRRATAIFGWDEKEALGQPLAELLIPERLRAEHHAGLDRFLKTGVARVLARRIELPALHRSGREFPVEIVITQIRSGAVPEFSAFVRDITERKRQEAQVQESEARFRVTANSAPVLIWMMDGNAHSTWFNQQWLDFVGRPLEQELGRGWMQNASPEDLARTMPLIEAAARAREPFRVEYRLRRADGQWRWMLVHGTPLLESNGRFSGYVGSAVDITERREAEKVLRESEHHFRTLAESLPLLVWTCRADGWCDFLSQQWLAYTGRTHEEQVGSGWAEQLHPEDRAAISESWQQSLATGQDFNVEFRIRRRDGEYRWFKTRAVALRDSAGAIVKWFGSNTDVDDVKRSESRLRTQLDRLVLLERITRAIAKRHDLTSLFEAVLASLEAQFAINFTCFAQFDAAGNAFVVRQVGPASQSIAAAAGLTPDTAMPAHEGFLRAREDELVHDRHLASSCFEWTRRLGAQGLECLVVAPVRENDEVSGVLLAARYAGNPLESADCEFLRQLCEHVALGASQAKLTSALKTAYEQLKATQDAMLQQERLRAFGEMASGVAHDINNVLSPAALSIDAILERDPPDPAETRRVLQLSQQAIESAAQTIARMREFYRQREPESVAEPVDLNRLAESVLALTRARWRDIPQQRGRVIDLECDLDAGLPTLAGVESELRDAFTNLVLNAVDAMPDGGTLSIRTGRAGSTVFAEVEDSGVGMNEATRQRCIEPFFTTKGREGTGLGLATVYGTTQRHGGELAIESAPGRGTRIRLTFPVASARVPAPTPTAAATVERVPRRVLLVDDDSAVRETLCKVLELDGHEITATEDGAHALDAFKGRQNSSLSFDIVISDLGMPKMDGRELAEAIKALSASTPVILLTGWGHSMDLEAPTPAHVDRVLGKPPKIAELRRAIFDLTGSVA